MNIPIFFYSNKNRLLANGYDFSISEKDGFIVLSIVDLVGSIKYEWMINQTNKNNSVLKIDTQLYKQKVANTPDEEHPTTTTCKIEYNYGGKLEKGYSCCRVFNFDSKGVKFQTTKTNTSEKWVMGGYYDLPNNKIIFFGGKDNQWPKIEITKKESQMEIVYQLGNATEETTTINIPIRDSFSKDDIILLIETLRNEFNDFFTTLILEELEALVSEMELREELESLGTRLEKFNENPFLQAITIQRIYMELAEITTKMNKCFAEKIEKEPQYHEFDAKTNVESLQALFHIVKRLDLRLVDLGENEWIIEDSNLNRVLSSQDFDIFYAPRLSQEDQVQKKLK